MTSLAALVLAHRDAAQVRRLIGALGDVPVVLHCDAKAPADVAGAMLGGWGTRVEALPRTSGQLNSWSLVRIELAGLRAVLRRTSASHVAVLSGADYPLVGMDELTERLQPWAGRSYLFNAPIPFPPWSVRRHRDGGNWRTAHRFLTRGDDLVYVKGVPLRLPWRRQRPAGLELRASSQWKIYSREDAQRLLDTVAARPDLVRFWRSTLVPDESFVASLLSSPAITGGQGLSQCYATPWFLSWPARGAHHPSWLDLSHFDELARARRAPAGVPERLTTWSDFPVQALFARKFASDTSAELLDRVDAELRRPQVS